MSSVRFRRIRHRLMIWHARGWFTPFCWDCRLLHSARRAGEFYAHDDPRWYFDEIMEHGERVEIIPHAPGTSTTGGRGQNWVFDLEHGARRVS